MSLARFGVSVPQQLIVAFDKRIRRKGYRSRSEALRDLMREHLVAGEWEESASQVVGTIAVVYTHATPELTQVLTEVQHRFHKEILCSTHVHLDQHNCLEVVVVRGTGRQVQSIADRLISTRGVKHGRLVCTTTGSDLS